VRRAALVSIQNFGPQGELMFIEGVTKDRSHAVRQECAYGLGKIGVSAFRTLLIALTDSVQAVRDSASAAILRNITVEEVVAEFSQKAY
jgi:HEAT repeat protein